MAPSATGTRKRDWRTILREELPRLLREDPEVRGQVFASLSEYLTTREETASLLAELREMRRAFAAKMKEQGQRLDEHSRRIEQLTAAVEHHGRILVEQGQRLERLTVAVEEQGRRLEEQGRRLEEHSRILAEHGERLERLTVAVEEQGRRLEEHSRILAEHSARLERVAAAVDEHSRILAEHGERLERLTVAVEEQGRRLEEHSRILAEHGERLERLTVVVEKLVHQVEVQGHLLEARGREIEALQRTLGGIGARWGLLAEETFREAVRTLFTEQPGVRVEHWQGRDDQGKIFGYPADVELDAVVRDGMRVLLEIKSSVSAADVSIFARKAAFYEESMGVRATRKLMVTPYADPKARETAARLGIEIVVGVTPPEL